jgi:hypothetical protein
MDVSSAATVVVVGSHRDPNANISSKGGGAKREARNVILTQGHSQGIYTETFMLFYASFSLGILAAAFRAS